MSPDTPFKQIHSELKALEKYLVGQISLLQKNMQAQTTWCVTCRKDTRALIAQLGASYADMNQRMLDLGTAYVDMQKRMVDFTRASAKNTDLVNKLIEKLMNKDSCMVINGK